MHVCVCVCVCVCVRETDKEKRALLKPPEEEHLGACLSSPVLQLLLCCLPLSPQWKHFVKRPDMNSFYAEMKLLMPTICYCQRAARTAVATQRGMQHQLESCTRQQWDTRRHLGTDGWPFLTELSIAFPAFTEHLFRQNAGSRRHDMSLIVIVEVVIVISVAVGEDKFDSKCHYFANPFSDCCRIISCC